MVRTRTSCPRAFSLSIAWSSGARYSPPSGDRPPLATMPRPLSWVSDSVTSSRTTGYQVYRTAYFGVRLCLADNLQFVDELTDEVYMRDSPHTSVAVGSGPFPRASTWELTHTPPCERSGAR